MRQELWAKVQLSYYTLVNEMDLMDNAVVDYLFSKFVLTFHEKDMLDQTKFRQDKSRLLLNILRTKSDNAYDSFLDALKESGGQKHLAKIVQTAASAEEPRGGSGGAPPDPMKLVPTLAFELEMDADGDTCAEGPRITSIVATHDGRFVMRDRSNDKVKVGDLTDPNQPLIESVKLDERPHRLAVLRDGKVALTVMNDRRIYFIDITREPRIESYVKTERHYTALGTAVENDTLVAACKKGQAGPASLDILNRAGKVIRSVTDSTKLTALSAPEHLCVQNHMAWVTDHDANAVFKVNLNSGDDVSTYTHTDLQEPTQVAVDMAGYCYVASKKKKCILVVSPEGQWQRLVTNKDHKDEQFKRPKALCVTDQLMLVSWEKKKKGHSEPHSIVVGYKFVKEHSDTTM